MPVYQLGPDIVFPPPRLAHPSGILAVGGDLQPERLLEAYRHGIFPWPMEEEPLVWWSPNPRFVLFPEKLHVTKNTERLIRSRRFLVTVDQNFPAVIHACKTVTRKGQDNTWITDDMEAAYVALHRLGHAHSVEVWLPDENQNKQHILAGGLYGITIGSCFCGESMFSKISNASKVGFSLLARALQQTGFTLIDCQTPTTYLASFGAESIPRKRFLELLLAARDSSLPFPAHI